MARRVGKYELLRSIGAGGMAEVWMGRQVLEGAAKAVAVKLMNDELSTSADARDQFKAEAQLSLALSNSNIVPMFDFGEQDGTLYLVMEWVDGMNLDQLNKVLWAQGRVLPLPVAAFVVGEILRGVPQRNSENKKIDKTREVCHTKGGVSPL
jgi:serine/threonine protein kinase